MQYTISRKDLRNHQWRKITREGDSVVESPRITQLIESLVSEVRNKEKKEGKKT